MLGGGAALSGLVACAPAKETGATPVEEEAGLFVPESIAETFDCEIAIVGGGLAGLAAAVQAGQNGSDVILLDEHDILGGNGSGIAGYYGVNTSLQKELGIAYSPGADLDAELNFSMYLGNGILWKDLFGHVAENFDWLVDCGVEFSGEVVQSKGRSEGFHHFKNRSAAEGYTPAMWDKAEELGIDIKLEHTAVSLIQGEDGSATGVYAQKADGSYIQVNAGAIILATGGYGDNLEYIRRTGYNNLEHFANCGYQDRHNGDGLRMAFEVGAKETLDDACGLITLWIEGLVPDSGASKAIVKGGPVVWVYKTGERFCREDVGDIEMRMMPIPHRNLNNETYTVMDQDGYKSLITTDELDAEFQAYLEKPLYENVYSADTIEELATKIGLDPNMLAKTIDRYNELCDQGEDLDFNKDPKYLKPIANPPYIIFRNDPSVKISIGGIDTDRSYRVLKEDGSFVPGLYAIGVDGSRLFHKVYPYILCGAVCSMCVDSGRTSANDAAEYIKGK